MRYGILLSPFHALNETPTESDDRVTLNRDTLSRRCSELAQRMIDKRAAKTGRKEVTDRRSCSLIS